MHCASLDDLRTLQSEGFFRYARSDLPQKKLFELLLLEEDTLMSPLTGRSFELDAEEVCEGQAGWHLEKLAPFLEGQGILILDPAVKYDQQGDVTLLTFRREVHELPGSEIECDSYWEVYSVAFFRIVNSLLERHGSAERLYAYYPFVNDQFGIFLTEPLFTLLCSMGFGDHLRRIDIEI